MSGMYSQLNEIGKRARFRFEWWFCLKININLLTRLQIKDAIVKLIAFRLLFDIIYIKANALITYIILRDDGRHYSSEKCFKRILQDRRGGL